MRKVTAVVGLALLGSALAGGGMWSYFKTAVNVVRGGIEENIPLEFQIARARDMVDDLVPEIRKNLEIIATEEVEIEQLAEKAAADKRKLADAKADILRMQSDLKEDKECYVYSGKEFTCDQVKHDLATKFERFKTSEARYDGSCQIRDVREQSLDAARQKLESIVDMKRQLEVDVEQLEASRRTQEIAAVSDKVNFDESKVGLAKKAIHDIQKRLEVADRVLNSETAYFGEIEIDDRQTDHIVDDVAAYFSKPDAIAKARP